MTLTLCSGVRHRTLHMNYFSKADLGARASALLENLPKTQIPGLHWLSQRLWGGSQQLCFHKPFRRFCRSLRLENPGINSLFCSRSRHRDCYHAKEMSLSPAGPQSLLTWRQFFWRRINPFNMVLSRLFFHSLLDGTGIWTQGCDTWATCAGIYCSY
jgi:hypothetical protein